MAEKANITRRTIIKAFPFIGAAVAMPVAAQAIEPEMTAEERRDFHLSEYKRACEEVDPMIRHWTDMDTTDACGGGTVSFRISGRYEGDGVYESGHDNVWGRRGKWNVALRSGDMRDGERLFTVECPGERMILTEPKLETFIGRKLA